MGKFLSLSESADKTTRYVQSYLDLYWLHKVIEEHSAGYRIINRFVLYMGFFYQTSSKKKNGYRKLISELSEKLRKLEWFKPEVLQAGFLHCHPMARISLFFF